MFNLAGIRKLKKLTIITKYERQRAPAIDDIFRSLQTGFSFVKTLKPRTIRALYR